MFLWKTNFYGFIFSPHTATISWAILWNVNSSSLGWVNNAIHLWLKPVERRVFQAFCILCKKKKESSWGQWTWRRSSPTPSCPSASPHLEVMSKHLPSPMFCSLMVKASQLLTSLMKAWMNDGLSVYGHLSVQVLLSNLKIRATFFLFLLLMFIRFYWLSSFVHTLVIPKLHGQLGTFSS